MCLTAGAIWARAGGRSSLQGRPSFDIDTYKLLDAYLKKPVAGSSLRLPPEDLSS
jgi:DNA polymerase-3 subunit epsilon